jgi:hypothetical protein
VESRRAAPPAGSQDPEVSSRPAAAGSRESRAGSPQPPAGSRQPAAIGDPAQLKEAFLEEIRKQKKFFHGTVVAQALRIEVQPDAITFHFAPHHKALRVQLEQTRSWLEETASRLAGRKMIVTSAEGAVPAGSPPAAPKLASATAAVPPDRAQDLKDRAMADNSVQAMLDVFAAEIKDIEEM